MSILLAFAIDAAWDKRQESQARAQLVESLILDFETSQLRLRDSIEFGQKVIDDNEQFCQGYNCTYPDIFSTSVAELLELARRPVINADLENVGNANSALVGLAGRCDRTHSGKADVQNATIERIGNGCC